MRLHALLVLPALLVAGVAAPSAAQAATGPVVTGALVGGDGPGDIVWAHGEGFTVGTAVAIRLVSETTPTQISPLASALPESDGSVGVPDGVRVPLTAAPGFYQLTMSQTGVVARFEVQVQEPRADLPNTIAPGVVGDPSTATNRIYLHGLANSPDAVRTVTIDDVVVPSVWWGDNRVLSYSGIGITPPAGLEVGAHRITFSQTGPTPYSVSGTVEVAQPTMTVGAHVGIRSPIPMSIADTIPNDDFDVTVVGAAGDRHSASVWSVRHTATGSGSTVAVTPSGTVSVGTATVTAVSRTNGSSASATTVVDPATAVSLAPDARITSPDGKVAVVMQSDGNLVEIQDGYPGPISRTPGHPGAQLTAQTDGNLVVRAANGTALWNTGTAGSGAGARLGFGVGDSPVLVLGNGRTAWSTFYPGHNRVVFDDLRAGGYLFQGQTLSSSANAEQPYSVNLDLQTDGNLVLTAYATRNVWSTRTVGHPGSYLVLQTDGNLVLRAANGAALWANGVRGVAGARLEPQFNGDLGEFAPDGRVVWHLGTRAALPHS